MADEEKYSPEIIDDWLASHRGKGVLCYTHALRIYFPMTHPAAEEEFERLRAVVNEIAGGSTVYDGEGSWCEEVPCTPEDVVIEPVKVIEANHHCTTERSRRMLAEALKRAASRTEQQAVGIAGTNKFMLIPTEELLD